MPIFIDNFTWMLLNVTLAFVPLIFAGLLRRKMKFPLYVVLLLMWMFFLPNTIYLITDMQYFPGQFVKAGLVEQVGPAAVDTGAAEGGTGRVWVVPGQEVVVEEKGIEREAGEGVGCGGRHGLGDMRVIRL